MNDRVKSRSKIIADLQIVMGSLRTFSELPLELTCHQKFDLPLYTLEKITYVSEPGDRVPAYLLTPKNVTKRTAAVLCLHQTTGYGKNEPIGLAGEPDLFYAKELAEQGFVCLVPDYPFLGENRSFNPYEHGYTSCSMKGIVNHMRGIDLLQSLKYVDPNNIGVIGHSLGGHNGLFVAAFDKRIKAIVSSCGFTSFRKYKNGNLVGWSGERYMPIIASKFNNNAELLPFDFSDILISLIPRPIFVNAPLHDENFDVEGVKECIAKAASVYRNSIRRSKKISVHYPNAGHVFPMEIRHLSYQFLNKWLM